MFKRRGEHRERQKRRATLPSDGPVDVGAIRGLIDELMATLPTGAAVVSEVHRTLHQYPGHRELDLDALELRIVPRATGALDVVIQVVPPSGGVNVYVGNSYIFELTAPIDVNVDPPRPLLDGVRQIIFAVAAGRIGVDEDADSQVVEVEHDGQVAHGGRAEKDELLAAPWS